MPTTNSTENTAAREIVISRVINAPRELAWEAMTNPEHIVHWWGPRGFTTTIEVMDVRTGGAWNLTMHGPDGTDYPNRSTFTEVTKPERLRFSHGGSKKGGPEANFEATWTFDTVEDDKTRVTIRMVFPTAAERDAVVKTYGAIEGGKQTLERLEEQLEKMAPLADRTFCITRVFDAPRELVWKAWTDPKHMAQWWGPRNFTNSVCDLDVRAGGRYRITMRSAEGAEYPLEGVYREIVEPERLVMTMDCSGHADDWHDMVNPGRDKTKKPVLNLVQTVTLEEEAGKTKLTICTRMESKAIRDAMVKMGMNEGWSQSLDRLAEVLAHLA